MGWAKAIRGLLSYYGTVFKTASKESYSISQVILSIVFMLLWLASQSVISRILHIDLSSLESIMDMNWWQATLMALGIIFAVRLLLAPYWMYKQKEREVGTIASEKQLLEKQLKEREKRDFSLVWYRAEWWLRTTNGKQTYWDDEIDGISLLLVGSVSVNTLKQIQVENVELDIGGHILKSDWESQGFYISEERDVNFDIPLGEPRGKRTVKLQAIVEGIQWQGEAFTIELPQGKQVFHMEGS